MNVLFDTKIVFKDNVLSVALNTPKKNAVNDVIFLTFDGLPGGLRSFGFGTEFLAKNNYTSLHITCSKNTSYQLVSPEDILDAVSIYVANKKVYLYGSSVGGYAALYFSSYLNGTAIAFSPLCPPDPVLKGLFKSGSQQEFLHIPLSEKDNDASLAQFVIYDSLVKTDNLFFNERVRPGFGSARIYDVPDGQHSVAKTLLNNGCLKKFFFSIVEDDCFPSNVEIDPLKNPVCYGKKALRHIQSGEIEKAYELIKKYRVYGVSSYVETAIKKLFFDYGYGFRKEEIALTKYRKNLYFRSLKADGQLSTLVVGEIGFYLNLASVFIEVFDFDAAKSIVDLGLAYYPESSELKKMSEKIDGFLLRVCL
ncbi:hypothetical protein LG409_06195 [Halomonas sp. NyZ770]|uniref:hypothetical protein n=1 Tax=Halomonas sp. NyZ770 TaxID=2883106 RepID=UPI001D0B64B4|nr:hypothetical protein [Halomonas sp. NyZ770]UDM08495.1 hypothetical protein LG409_06195 [Halomonas sp. NyZ770]